jgi:basic membrane protein A
MLWKLTKSSAACIAACLAFIALLPGAASAEPPKQLGIAFILSAGIESAWDGTLIDDIEAIKAERPHGLEIEYTHSDPLWGDEAAEAIRLFASTGQYGIIWAHSSYSDQVEAVKDEFPDILFVVVGSGNEGLGENVYWVYKRLHEPSYLLGVAAGRLTETDTIGVIGQFPSEDVNDQINAFFAGARSVNPDLTQRVAFIESWYDPAKTADFTNAQISAGADLVFPLVSSYRACETGGILCFGNYRDEVDRSPETIVASALLDWTPDLNWVIDAWWAHKAEGKPYDGNTAPRWFSMAEGGAALSDWNPKLDDRIPGDVKQEVADLEATIMAGDFEVPVDLSMPQSK